MRIRRRSSPEPPSSPSLPDRLPELLCAKAAADVRGINSGAVIKAMEWSWALGANVINLSLGFPITGCLDGQSLLCKMVADLSDQGVVVIVAAGHNDHGLRVPPLIIDLHNAWEVAMSDGATGSS